MRTKIKEENTKNIFSLKPSHTNRDKNDNKKDKNKNKGGKKK